MVQRTADQGHEGMCGTARRPSSGGRGRPLMAVFGLAGGLLLVLCAGRIAAGEAELDADAPTCEMIFGWDTLELTTWTFGNGMVAPLAAHPVTPENPSGLVLPVPGLGWFEDFSVSLAEPGAGWATHEFLALDYQEGPDRFRSGWLGLGLVFTSPRNWWYMVPRAELTLDGQWHAAVWRYEPQQLGGAPLVFRLTTSTGDAGTLLVDRLRWLLPLFRFDCEDQSMDGWTLAEGSGLETRPERVHQGVGSCRLLLPASTWHRAAWRSFAPGAEARALARCNRLALMVHRFFGEPAGERTFRLRLRLAWLSEPDTWGETEAVEVMYSDVWESITIPLSLADIDPSRPLRLYLITESFVEEEIYIDSARLLRVD